MTYLGNPPANRRRQKIIEDWMGCDKNPLMPQDLSFVTDTYDACIADLDEQLGMLVEELGRRGVLNRTWLIITADHGESFGEHSEIFSHGTSLYQSELHVPLSDRAPRRLWHQTVVERNGQPAARYGGDDRRHARRDVVAPRSPAIRWRTGTVTIDVKCRQSRSPHPGSRSRSSSDWRMTLLDKAARRRWSVGDGNIFGMRARTGRSYFTWPTTPRNSTTSLMIQPRPILEQMKENMHRLTGQPGLLVRSGR